MRHALSEHIFEITEARRPIVTMHYFPDYDDPALQPFTQAFVRLMFAHARFEQRALDLWLPSTLT